MSHDGDDFTDGMSCFIVHHAVAMISLLQMCELLREKKQIILVLEVFLVVSTFNPGKISSAPLTK